MVKKLYILTAPVGKMGLAQIPADFMINFKKINVPFYDISELLVVQW